MSTVTYTTILLDGDEYTELCSDCAASAKLRKCDKVVKVTPISEADRDDTCDDCEALLNHRPVADPAKPFWLMLFIRKDGVLVETDCYDRLTEGEQDELIEESHADAIAYGNGPKWTIEAQPGAERLRIWDYIVDAQPWAE